MQATRGDVEGPRPGFHQPMARARWTAWAELEGAWSSARAKTKYVDEVAAMMRRHGTSDPKDKEARSGWRGRLPDVPNVERGVNDGITLVRTIAR